MTLSNLIATLAPIFSLFNFGKAKYIFVARDKSAYQFRSRNKNIYSFLARNKSIYTFRAGR